VMRELKHIEYSGVPGEPIYFVFSNHVVDRTEAYAGGEVNVDVDHYDEVVGIELLNGSPKNFDVFFDIVKDRQLGISGMHLAPQRAT
jgi:uncharacterized protein YuzE